MAARPAFRPDQVCDPKRQRATYLWRLSAELRAGLTWFNTACFAAVPQGVVRPGNTGRYTVRGPGFFNLDASLMKNFNISKEGRFKLQVRAETFNTLNWVNRSGSPPLTIPARCSARSPASAPRAAFNWVRRSTSDPIGNTKTRARRKPYGALSLFPRHVVYRNVACQLSHPCRASSGSR